MDKHDRTAVVVVGGGILGCSIAWHLAREGQSDVVVLERNDIGSGATSQSAGLVSRGRLHVEMLRMVARTHEAFRELEAELGEPVGFRRVGNLRVAESEARERELVEMDRLLCDHGVEVRNVDAHEARALVPWLDASAARRISLVEDDGYVDAYRLASAYARAARARGVRFRVSTAVGGVVHDGARVTGVQTGSGTLHAEAVVDAAGAWGIAFASAAGFALGAAPVRSHYWITAPDPSMPRDHPTVYLPDVRAYARPEVGGLLFGVQEPQSRTYDARAIPDDVSGFPPSNEDEDWSMLLDHAPALRRFIPGLDEFRFAHHIAGLSTYTPDGRFVLGRAGPLDGFHVAGGCCGNGVAASGGIGEAIASVVLGRAPPVDLSPFRPDRFGPVDPTREDFRASCAAARAGKSRRG